MSELTVVTFKWSGWRDLYNYHHVNTLKKMLKEYITIPHKFVCITDNPKGMKCDTYPLWKDVVVKNKPTHHDSYCRLKMFSEELAKIFPGWVLMMDLDVLILANIDDLITWDDFRILKGGVSRYNGSMWLHKMGTRTYIWDTFDPITSPFEVPKYKTSKGKRWVGSDQGWISVCCDGESMYDARDGVFRWSTRVRKLWKNKSLKKQKEVSNARVVFFPGAIKPWHGKMKRSYPDIYEEYKRWMK